MSTPEERRQFLRHMARRREERYIKKCLEWIARHKANLGQLEKQFKDQYPMISPERNRERFEDLEAKRLEIFVHEYELGGFIKDYLDKYPEDE